MLVSRQYLRVVRAVHRVREHELAEREQAGAAERRGATVGGIHVGGGSGGGSIAHQFGGQNDTRILVA